MSRLQERCPDPTPTGFDRSESKADLLGIGVDSLSFREAVLSIGDLVSRGTPSIVVTPNVDHIMILQKDPVFREIYEHAALVLPDGVPLLWAARYLGTPLKGRVAGSDLLPAICGLADQRHYRLFFLGGPPGVVDKLKLVVQARHPGARIVGTFSPSYGFENKQEEIQRICTMVNKAKPDILFVGLGAPKQEKFIWKYRALLNVPVSIGVGAALEFLAGTLPRAPKWMQRTGLEWLYRLIKEPRLFKRYSRDLQFFRLVYLQKTAGG